MHGIVSILADGFFLQRCIECSVKPTVEHYLPADSSSARQLACRQGSDKNWIQSQIHEKMVAQTQVSTVWNVADVGTKVLSAKRLKLLLHHLGMFTQDAQRVGEEEVHETIQRSGG